MHTAPFAARVARYYTETTARMRTVKAAMVLPLSAAIAIALCAFAPANAHAAQSPGFLYGAAFFYERVPRSQWAAALARYRSMGINTIDVYVMWNWHEPTPGRFDFTGRTNSRRDLVGLFKLLHADGMRVVLRPGPVIRNEWRNAGYPAWLLERPAYRMPLRDVLEGRYPAAATLQNEHSDAAAAEWMRNRVHMRYATLWLQTVLRILTPWRGDIFAVALDDDQGAYLDNDTWPAPHFHKYISYLKSVVHGVMGKAMPVFINTYEMKVTASAPVWAWGDWYQSDAYSIGEHDRAQLEFSTGLLATQPGRPVMIGEFQAGWLQGADQAAPRAADPSNTTLALHTLLQLGVHGIVDFPLQDTLSPAGWEAPWTNAFYSWDAALSVQLSPQARYAPTQRFGDLVARYGRFLARTHPAADAALAYLTSAYDASKLHNADVARIAQATMAAQRGCRVMHVTCAMVDLRYAGMRDLQRYDVLIAPPNGVRLPYISSVTRKLARFRAAGGRIVPSARAARIESPAAGGIPDAALLVADDRRYAFLDVVNYGWSVLHTRPARVHGGRFSGFAPELSIPPRDALLLPLGIDATKPPQRPAVRGLAHGFAVPLRSGSYVRSTLRSRNGVYSLDVYQDGYPAVIFENAGLRLIVSPCAGARSFVFEDKRTGENLFTTVGGLRDAWTPQLPPSPRDYIAAYTHPIAAGTFNRCYATRIRAAGADFAYTAPDAPPHGASYHKHIALSASGSFFVTTLASFNGAGKERAQQLTSFALGPDARIYESINGLAIYEPSRERATLAAWAPAGVQAHSLARHAQDALLTLTFARGHACETAYGLARVRSPQQAQAALRKFAKRP